MDEAFLNPVPPSIAEQDREEDGMRGDGWERTG
jgi:hypothetical protein